MPPAPVLLQRMKQGAHGAAAHRGSVPAPAGSGPTPRCRPVSLRGDLLASRHKAPRPAFAAVSLPSLSSCCSTSRDSKQEGTNACLGSLHPRSTPDAVRRFLPSRPGTRRARRCPPRRAFLPQRLICRAVSGLPRALPPSRSGGALQLRQKRHEPHQEVLREKRCGNCAPWHRLDGRAVSSHLPAGWASSSVPPQPRGDQAGRV